MPRTGRARPPEPYARQPQWPSRHLSPPASKWVFISLPGEAKTEPWSYDEVEQTVPDYMSVLRAELAGESYHKTDHRNAWLNLLARRNGPPVEFEHCNISVVLQRRNSPALTVPTANPICCSGPSRHLNQGLIRPSPGIWRRHRCWQYLQVCQVLAGIIDVGAAGTVAGGFIKDGYRVQ
jgi:hypothetical protein